MPPDPLVLGIQVDNVAAIPAAMKESAAAVSTAAGSIRNDFHSIEDESEKLEYSVTEARHALMGMGEEIGVHVPRFVSTFVASMGAVGPALEAAFSVVAVIGIIQVLGEVPEAFEKIKGAITGWDEKEKKAYEAFLENNRKAIDSANELAKKIDEISLIGLEGSRRRAAEEGVVQRETKRVTDELSSNLNTIKKLTEANDELLRRRVQGGAVIGEETLRWAWNRLELNENAAVIERLTKANAELGPKLKALQLDGAPAAAKETEDARRKEAEAVAVARIDAEEKVKLARIAASEEAAKQQHDLVMLNTDETIAVLIELENEKLTIQSSAIKKRIALAQKQEEETGKATLPERIKLHADLEALEESYQTRIAGIRYKYVTESDRETGRIFALGAKLAAENNERANAEVDKMGAEAARENIARAKHTAMEIFKATEEQARSSIEVANSTLSRETAINDERLRLHRSSIGQWASDEKAALDKWYERSHTTLLQLANFERERHGEDSAEYRRVIAELIRLDDQRAEKVIKTNEKIQQSWQKAMNVIDREFNDNVAKLITGQETLGQALAKSWETIAQNAIRSMLKTLEQHVIISILHESISKESEEKDALRQAAKAARNVFAEVMKLPFPLSVVLAPAAAAAAFAGVMAFGSFDRGGVVPDDMLAQVHKNEMVLDPGLSAAVQNMAKSGMTAATAGGGPRDIHVHYNVPESGRDTAMQRQDIVAAVKKGLRYGQLSLA